MFSLQWRDFLCSTRDGAEIRLINVNIPYSHLWNNTPTGMQLSCNIHTTPDFAMQFSKWAMYVKSTYFGG